MNLEGWVSPNGPISEEDPEDEDTPVWFKIGKKDGEYYHLSKDVLGLENDLFIHESVKLTSKTFIAERNMGHEHTAKGLVLLFFNTIINT